MGATRSSARSACGLALAASLLLAACGGSSGNQPGGNTGAEQPRKPVPGGKVNVAIAGEADGYNSTVNRWSSSTLFQARAIFDPLTAFDEKGEAQPYLAESFTPNADFTEWTIKTRPNVKFHDGTPMNADALKTHLDTARSSSVTGSTMSLVTSIEKTDDAAVKVKMSAPWSHFPVIFASQVGFVAAPAQLAKNDSVSPIGTGPFSFKSWTPGQPMISLKNKEYWRKDADGQAMPYLDEVQFTAVTDPKSRLSGLEAGTYDMMQTDSADEVIDLSNKSKAGTTGDITVLLDKSEGTEAHVLFNNSTGAFADKKLRQAAAHATNRKALVDQLFQGYYPIANGPFTKESTWGEPSSYPQFDPAKAKGLVDEWKSAHGGQAPAVTLSVIESADFLQLAQAIAKQWNDAGFDAKVDTFEEKVGTVKLVTGNFEAVAFNFYDRPDPDALYHYWVSTSMGGPGKIGLNFAQYASPTVDQALNAGRASNDPKTRVAEYQKVWNDFAENLPVIWLYHTQWVIAYRNSLKSVGTLTYPGNTTKVEPVTWGNLFLTGVWKG